MNHLSYPHDDEGDVTAVEAQALGLLIPSWIAHEHPDSDKTPTPFSKELLLRKNYRSLRVKTP